MAMKTEAKIHRMTETNLTVEAQVPIESENERDESGSRGELSELSCGDVVSGGGDGDGGSGGGGGEGGGIRSGKSNDEEEGDLENIEYVKKKGI
ncbi:hypothetical protein L6452_19352 [Arctium lappa]|uniref:Uncharacterized protein n=1 Tax=Arctium lappa TaxID=4217 RepID=A0ACB9B964_ARCLA|nr:hypothetical protein L6452_19352 [Arctium lappa]